MYQLLKKKPPSEILDHSWVELIYTSPDFDAVMNISIALAKRSEDHTWYPPQHDHLLGLRTTNDKTDNQYYFIRKTQ
jgi:hypothetical protein